MLNPVPNVQDKWTFNPVPNVPMFNHHLERLFGLNGSAIGGSPSSSSSSLSNSSSASSSDSCSSPSSSSILYICASSPFPS